MMINWLDTILEYSFDVVHIPGMDNTLPDQLSRLFPLKKELAGGTVPHNTSHDKQTPLQNNAINVTGKQGNNNSSEEQEDDIYFEPPEHDCRNLLKDTHAFGHFGAKAMVEQLHQDGLKWSNMHREAQEIVHTCP